MIITVRNAAVMILLLMMAGFTPLPGREKMHSCTSAVSTFSKSVSGDYSVKNNAGVHAAVNPAPTGVNENAFSLAMKGLAYCRQKGLVSKTQVITIIDFSRPATQKRLFVIDISRGKLLLQSLVAHGKNSGEKYASRFSNRAASNQSSLGMYVTLGTYTGRHGYSLRLKGCEAGINDNAYSRDIVLHSAAYVSASFIAARGFPGRSEGCPAVPENVHRKLIDCIKGGSCLFIYHPSPDYIKNSKLLNW